MSAHFEEGGLTLSDSPSFACRALTVDFPFEQVMRDLDGDEPNTTSIDVASEAIRRVFSWVYQPPCSDLDGFFCRTIIACWVFVPQLRSYTMTEIAGRYGKKKQSLGRWVVDFKREFPAITQHLQHLKHNE